MTDRKSTTCPRTELERRSAAMAESVVLAILLSRAPQSYPIDATSLFRDELRRRAAGKASADVGLALLTARLLAHERGRMPRDEIQ